MKNIKKVQQGVRNSLIKDGLPANEKHHQEQPKYQILYLLGNKRKQNRSILLQQILSYFLVPLVIAGPLAFALSTALLGYFENFANTSISIDITYLGVAVLLFVLYLLVTYRVSWQMIEN